MLAVRLLCRMFFRLNLWLMHKHSSGVCGIQRCPTGRLRVVCGRGLVRRRLLCRSRRWGLRVFMGVVFSIQAMMVWVGGMCQCAMPPLRSGVCGIRRCPTGRLRVVCGRGLVRRRLLCRSRRWGLRVFMGVVFSIQAMMVWVGGMYQCVTLHHRWRQHQCVEHLLRRLSGLVGVFLLGTQLHIDIA